MEELIEGVNARTCTSCGELKHRDSFANNKCDKTLGKQYTCKACQAEYRAKNRERASQLRRERYLRNKDKENTATKLYYQQNKEWFAEYKKQYRLDNAEAIQQYGKEYNKLNSESNKEYQKEYYLLNKERVGITHAEYYANNKESVQQAHAKWRQENPEVVTALSAKRRSSQLQRTPCWLTEEDYKAIEDFYYLAKALTEATGIQHVVDHIIPLQGTLVSGLHHPNNLQILTRIENASKGNKFKPF